MELHTAYAPKQKVYVSETSRRNVGGQENDLIEVANLAAFLLWL